MQVGIIGPCTFLVTAAVTGDKSIGLMSRISHTYKTKGIGGFYSGGTALIFRQGTNWYVFLSFSLYLYFIQNKYTYNLHLLLENLYYLIIKYIIINMNIIIKPNLNPYLNPNLNPNQLGCLVKASRTTSGTLSRLSRPKKTI